MNCKWLWYLQTLNSRAPHPESRPVRRLIPAAGPDHGPCLDHLRLCVNQPADLWLVAAAVASKDGIRSAATAQATAVSLAVLRGTRGAVEEHGSADLTTLLAVVVATVDQGPAVPVAA